MTDIKDFVRMHSKVIKNKKEKDERYGSQESDYSLLKQVGKGSFGEVYKVKAKNGKSYALKKIAISKLTSK